VKKMLWFFAGALVLLALVLGLRKFGDRALNREGFVFDTSDVAEVVYLRVVYQGDTAELDRKQGEWVTIREGVKANPARVERALRGLLGIRSQEKVSESPDEARLAEFGIGAADAKQVDWTLASGKKARVLLGKTSGNDLNSTYWKWEDEAAVYSTPGDFTFDLASREQEWKADGPAPAFNVQ
jgi:hypothetical protein